MSDYADTLKPELGTIWHVMDNSTRYMIANLITRQREKEDTEEIFCKAKKHNEGITSRIEWIDTSTGCWY